MHGIQPPYYMANRRGKCGSSDRFPLLGLQNHCGWWLQPWNQKLIASWQENNDKPRQHVEKQRHYSADKVLYSQGYGLPSGHAWLCELDCKEGRMPNNWCLWTVVLEKTPESPWDSKEIKLVNLKEDQPWIFTGKDWCWSWSSSILVMWCKLATHWERPWCLERSRAEGEKRASEDEMAEQHHQCNEHELEQALGDGEGQGGLVSCSPWGHRELDMRGDSTTTTSKYFKTKSGK